MAAVVPAPVPVPVPVPVPAPVAVPVTAPALDLPGGGRNAAGAEGAAVAGRDACGFAEAAAPALLLAGASREELRLRADLAAGSAA